MEHSRLKYEGVMLNDLLLFAAQRKRGVYIVQKTYNVSSY